MVLESYVNLNAEVFDHCDKVIARLLYRIIMYSTV